MAITGTPSILCIPEIGPCNPRTPTGGNPTGNPYFTECDLKWNCNLCKNDKKFFMPFEEGDIINFQNNALSGLTSVTLTTLSGTPIVGGVTITPTANGELVTVTTPSGRDCFSITNEHPDGDSCVNGDYQKVDCESTFKIKGNYKDGEMDCFGNVYPFDNTTRMWGYLTRGKQDNIEKTPFGDNYKKKKVESYWTLVIDKLVPPFVHDILTKQMLLANSIEIEYNGYTYEFITDDSFTLASVDVKSQMFAYDKNIRLKQVCEVTGAC